METRTQNLRVSKLPVSQLEIKATECAGSSMVQHAPRSLSARRRVTEDNLCSRFAQGRPDSFISFVDVFECGRLDLPQTIDTRPIESFLAR